MRKIIKILLSLLLVSVTLLWADTLIKISRSFVKADPTIFDREYTVTIKNEHLVWCIWEKDTVKLYFENAYGIAGEKFLYIDKK